MKKILKDIFIHKKGNQVIRRLESTEVEKFIAKLYPRKINLPLIRIGNFEDGGYIVPEDLLGIAACFSPGVDTTSSFEMDCYNRGIKIFLADKSVSNPNLNLNTSEYDFVKKHIGIINSDEIITMDKWVQLKVPGETDLLLQMDIEGAEYESIINLSERTLDRFRIIVVEFHSLHELWNPWFFKLASLAFEKILQNHICVHIHPNNCCGMVNKFGIEIPCVAEFTFIRKDRVTTLGYCTTFPHELDVPNTNKPDLALPRHWYA